MEAKEFCRDCKQETDVVSDHRSGDTICTFCGLILEARYIDERAEWRNFADQNPEEDRTRVGKASDPLLDNGVLSTWPATSMKEPSGEILPIRTLKKTGLASEKPPIRCWIMVFFPLVYSKKRRKTTRRVLMPMYLEEMADRLDIYEGVPKCILDHAKGLYKKADDKNFCKGRNSNPIMAACLLLAFEESQNTRTLKEITMVANGPSKKEISKMKEELKRSLGIASKIKSAMDLWPRHCSNLGMSSKDKKAVEEALKNLANFDIRRNPNSVVAAVMYMVVQLSNGNNCSVQDVSKAADGVAVGTTKRTYKDIYPYASQIIPTWFCRLEDLKKLITP
ncbi:hypothetical protein C1H46_019062 [Malus baccata]|uniref:TFIIB-type domain-containing protein n=1 Tax=Malus baccata TaxID=106549 RepID=A0A540M942_MALBA|nr:hypothetical protein C1H46_019062 [Malus baccata]